MARHRAQEHTNDSFTQADALVAERSRWEQMKAELNAQINSVPRRNSASPVEAAILARRVQGDLPPQPTFGLPNSIDQRDSMPDLAARSRHAQGAASLPNNVAQKDSISDVEASFLARSRRLGSATSFPWGVPLSDADAAFLARVRQAKASTPYQTTVGNVSTSSPPKWERPFWNVLVGRRFRLTFSLQPDEI